MQMKCDEGTQKFLLDEEERRLCREYAPAPRASFTPHKDRMGYRYGEEIDGLDPETHPSSFLHTEEISDGLDPETCLLIKEAINEHLLDLLCDDNHGELVDLGFRRREDYADNLRPNMAHGFDDDLDADFAAGRVRRVRSPRLGARRRVVI